MNDLIKRRDALKIAKSAYDGEIPLILVAECIEALPSADAVSGYTEWLEKIIVDAETFEWLCEDTNDREWCANNCRYSSIQAECLRHLYEVSKGGDLE